MSISYRHIGIVTSNLERQLNFYTNILGMEVYYHQVESGEYIDNLIGKHLTYPEIYKLGFNNNIIVELLCFHDNLYKYKNGRLKLNEPGITHFALTIDNIDILYNKMVEEGIKFVNYPLQSPDNKVKVCFCRDYDGNYIELVQPLN